MISTANYRKKFPRYPQVTEDHGWFHGVWYCGGFKKAKLHGAYPNGFLERALALFPGATDVLHCPSGTVEGPGMTVDLKRDEVRRPKVIASADDLPFSDGSFDLILSDPPYTREDSKLYGCKPFPMEGFMREALRLLKPGGFLGMLHTYIPQYRRVEWDLRGLIAVTTGFKRATRIFSLFETRADHDRWREVWCGKCGVVGRIGQPLRCLCGKPGLKVRMMGHFPDCKLFDNGRTTPPSGAPVAKCRYCRGLVSPERCGRS